MAVFRLKLRGKNTVNNGIHQKETNAWEQRLSSESEFYLFQTIYPWIKPAVVYTVYKCTLEVNPEALLGV